MRPPPPPKPPPTSLSHLHSRGGALAVFVLRCVLRFVAGALSERRVTLRTVVDTRVTLEGADHRLSWPSNAYVQTATGVGSVDSCLHQRFDGAFLCWSRCVLCAKLTQHAIPYLLAKADPIELVLYLIPVLSAL